MNSKKRVLLTFLLALFALNSKEMCAASIQSVMFNAIASHVKQFLSSPSGKDLKAGFVFGCAGMLGGGVLGGLGKERSLVSVACSMVIVGGFCGVGGFGLNNLRRISKENKELTDQLKKVTDELGKKSADAHTTIEQTQRDLSNMDKQVRDTSLEIALVNNKQMVTHNVLGANIDNAHRELCKRYQDLSALCDGLKVKLDDACQKRSVNSVRVHEKFTRIEREIENKAQEIKLLRLHNQQLVLLIDNSSSKGCGIAPMNDVRRVNKDCTHLALDQFKNQRSFPSYQRIQLPVMYKDFGYGATAEQLNVKRH